MDEALSDNERNTCLASYVIADSSRSMTYYIINLICKWKNEDLSIKKWCLFYSKNKIVHCLNNSPKRILFFGYSTLCHGWTVRDESDILGVNMLINARFTKIQSVLVHSLRFRSYDHANPNLKSFSKLIVETKFPIHFLF